MKKRSSSQRLKLFFYPVSVDPWLYAKGILCHAIFSCYSVYSVIVIKNTTTFLEQGKWNEVVTTLTFFSFLSVAYFLSVYLTRYIRNTYITHKTINILHRKYMHAFFGLDSCSVEKMGTGRVIAIMNDGIKVWRTVYKDGVKTIPDILIITSFAFITIFSLIGALGWFFLLYYAITIFFVYHINKKAIFFRKQKKDANVAYTRQFVRSIMAKNEILQTGNGEKEIALLDTYMNEEMQQGKKVISRRNLVYSIPPFVIVTIRIGVFLFIGWQIIHAQASFSLLTTLLAVMALLEMSTNRAVDFYAETSDKFADIEKLRDMFATIPPMTNLYTGKEFSFIQGDISLSHITFSYVKNTPVFENFSLQIKGGVKTAFVGPSGGGKSTLLKFFAGYIRPDEGSIKIDGQYLVQSTNPQPPYQGAHVLPDKGGAQRAEGLYNEISLQSYYRHIGYLTQDPSVFDGTVYENLLYGINPPPSPSFVKGEETNEVRGEDLKNIISLAQCDFIRELPHGLDTEIGERGVRLSGGQKQRLAIAKIMRKNPSIVLLDEPTSALDSFNEEKISIALRNLLQGKTVIVVAHRLQTVKEADIIHYVEGGKIVESGTHQELVQKEGRYKKMLDVQTGF